MLEQPHQKHAHGTTCKQMSKGDALHAQVCCLVSQLLQHTYI